MNSWIKNLVELFCAINGFFIELQKKIISKTLENLEDKKQKSRPPQLSEREIMSIVIYFQNSGFRNFKQYYLAIQITVKITGISFIDSSETYV